MTIPSPRVFLERQRTPSLFLLCFEISDRWRYSKTVGMLVLSPLGLFLLLKGSVLLSAWASLLLFMEIQYKIILTSPRTPLTLGHFISVSAITSPLVGPPPCLSCVLWLPTPIEQCPSPSLRSLDPCCFTSGSFPVHGRPPYFVSESFGSRLPVSSPGAAAFLLLLLFPVRFSAALDDVSPCTLKPPSLSPALTLFLSWTQVSESA